MLAKLERNRAPHEIVDYSRRMLNSIAYTSRYRRAQFDYVKSVKSTIAETKRN